MIARRFLSVFSIRQSLTGHRGRQKVKQLEIDIFVPGDLADELLAAQVLHLIKECVVAAQAQLVKQVLQGYIVSVGH